jgi:hypothetical protein
MNLDWVWYPPDPPGQSYDDIAYHIVIAAGRVYEVRIEFWDDFDYVKVEFYPLADTCETPDENVPF